MFKTWVKNKQTQIGVSPKESAFWKLRIHYQKVHHYVSQFTK